MESSRRSRFTVVFYLPYLPIAWRRTKKKQAEEFSESVYLPVCKCVFKCQWQWIRWTRRTGLVVCFQVSTMWSNCNVRTWCALLGAENLRGEIFCGWMVHGISNILIYSLVLCFKFVNLIVFLVEYFNCSKVVGK